jgi:hypothetical protein
VLISKRPDRLGVETVEASNLFSETDIIHERTLPDASPLLIISHQLPRAPTGMDRRRRRPLDASDHTLASTQR